MLSNKSAGMKKSTVDYRGGGVVYISANEECQVLETVVWGMYHIYSNYHVYIRESIVSMGWVHSKTIRLL